MKSILRSAILLGLLLILISCGKDTGDSSASSAAESVQEATAVESVQETISAESLEESSFEEVPENVTVEYESDEVVEIH